MCRQNSTVMWEKLPMALMEEVLRVHHTTLRSLLDKHNGYESATEGDSFILAFHSPSDALAYAIEAQQCLLAAAWPQELLDTCDEAGVVDAVTCAHSSWLLPA
jgi:class 3 adenylate cyclase